jgi:hypothetical protein
MLKIGKKMYISSIIRAKMPIKPLTNTQICVIITKNKQIYYKINQKDVN